MIYRSFSRNLVSAPSPLSPYFSQLCPPFSFFVVTVAKTRCSDGGWRRRRGNMEDELRERVKSDNGNCRFHSYSAEMERVISYHLFIVVVARSRPDFPRCWGCQLSPFFLLSLSFSSLSHFTLSIHSNSTLGSTSRLDMDSSTSPNPPSPLGECVVCGKESSTRCSKCSQGGVDWMYFCSREHQKLVSAA